MNKIDSIPTGKMQRVTKLVTTGVKVGGNYLKYYGEKVVNPSLTKDKLHESNASDIYDGLKELKGSALKVAQMLSMEKNLLPQSYVDKFSLSQFSVPPLSAPLVRKTFKTYFKQYPEELFEEDKKFIQNYLFARFSALSADEFFKLAKMILRGDAKATSILELLQQLLQFEEQILL